MRSWNSDGMKIVAAGSLLVFVFLSVLVLQQGAVDHWEQIFEQWLIGHAPKVLRTSAEWIGMLGSNAFVPWMALIFTLLLVWKREWVLAAAGLSAPFVGQVVVSLGKTFFGRTRPIDLGVHDADKFSFPSGHATNAMVLYGFLILLLWTFPLSKTPRWILTVVLALLILTIDASRLILGVHYPSDVIAGNALGVLIVSGMIAFFDRVHWWVGRGSNPRPMA